MAFNSSEHCSFIGATSPRRRCTRVNVAWSARWPRAPARVGVSPMPAADTVTDDPDRYARTARVGRKEGGLYVRDRPIEDSKGRSALHPDHPAARRAYQPAVLP